MMRLFILLLLFATVLSCECEEASPQPLVAVCGVENPQRDLKWLRDLISQIKADPKYVSVVITAFDYQEQTVFNIQDMISSCAFCDLRKCSGQKFTPADFNDFLINKRNEREVWCQNPDLCVN